jgi:hypothetical protein
MAGIQAPYYFASPFARGDGVNEPSDNGRADIVNLPAFGRLQPTSRCPRRCRPGDLPSSHRRGGRGPL